MKKWFSNKNKENNELNEIIDKNGLKRNDAVEPRKEKRKDTKAKVENERISNSKREQLKEELKKLRKKMYGLDNVDRELDKLDRSINTLSNSDDNQNLRAMGVVDSFILKSIEEALNHCNRNNLPALASSIMDIDELVSDRQSCGACYTDPKYVQFKLEKNRLYLEQQNQESKLNKLRERVSELVADYNNPAFVNSQASIARNLDRLKKEGQRTTALLNKIESRISFIESEMGVIEENTIYEGGNVDIISEADDVLVTKKQNEAQNKQIEKLNDKINEPEEVSSSALNINDTTESVSLPKTINLDDYKF